MFGQTAGLLCECYPRSHPHRKGTPCPITRRVCIALAAVAVLLGIGLTTAGPASAGVGCYGDYCSGQDPQATHCSDGSYTVSATSVYYRTIAHQATGLYAGYLELRWSPTCQTNWARFTSQGSFNYKVIAIHRTTGYQQSWDAGPYQMAWTSQIYSPRLCVAAVVQVKADGWVFPSTTTTACI